ncbi:DUF4265 domain-containing protein [Streptomyces avermitilis]
MEQFRMVALDVPPDADLTRIRKLLEHGEAKGWWHWEEGAVTDAWRATAAEVIGRLVACHAEWSDLLPVLAASAGAGFLFRPGRQVEAAKNLASSWPARYRPPAPLPRVSVRRLRTTWIVGLLSEGISPSVVAEAAGMASPAGLAPYHRWVPPLPREEILRLLHRHRR